jgi:hypothetical protein
MEIYREVKERPPERSGAVTWSIRIIALLAVPVVYLFSVPPLILGTLEAQTAFADGQSGPKMQSPPWVKLYAVPYGWVASSKLLRKPLDRYADWCLAMTER